MPGVTAETRPTILVVDDEPHVRDLLSRWLGDAGYECLAAANCQEARAHLDAHPIALATLDISLPGGSGFDLLAHIGERHADTAAIMLTGEATASMAIAALTGGAFGYLIKPVDREELLFQVSRGLERRNLIIDKRNYTERLERRVREQTQELRRACEETIYRLVAACAYRDVETGDHARRTGLLGEVLALAAGWSAADAERMRLAAPMHDVGKIAIPDAILQKPGRLTPAEFEVMKQHTVIGAKILTGSASAILQMAEIIALCHHERWNGRGYPAGLAGDDIPQAARIVAIVDVYDALTHSRIYRPPLSEAEAVALMIEKSGSHFDPRLLELFLDRLPEMRRISAQNDDTPRGKHLVPMDLPSVSAGEMAFTPSVAAPAF
jgi:putative two-component system response regulator